MTMEAARAAVAKFTSKVGHHTDVEELVNPAVTHETVKPTRHEELTEAIDREVHQHHYHTTVQPISHREVLPEKHVHNMIPIEKREFHHGDHDAVKRGVSAEIGRFANHSITHEVQHTRSAAPAVTGEHVHHHVHETVQPIIHKETIQPEVVHTTVPIHEVHHAEATHHGMSALPMKTLEEFTKAGGIIVGSSRHTHEQYEGAPRPYNKELQTTAEKVLHGITGHHRNGSNQHNGRTSMSSVERRELEQHNASLGHGTGHGTGVGDQHMSSAERRELEQHNASLGHGTGVGSQHMSDVERRELEQHNASRGLVGHSSMSDHRMPSTTTTTSTSTNTTTGIKTHKKRDSGIGTGEEQHNNVLSH